ncbi:MAG: hypothetical protein IPL61_18095 [Myxococcales bacterium]|nr:hypothetical protein [Myxococcales bacterium]
MSEIRDVLRAAKQRDPKAFEFSNFTPVVAGDYKKALAAGLVVGDPSAVGLKPIVGDRAGGYYLTWERGPIKSCIVYVGAEGQKYVAAGSEAELISMLPYGDGVTEAMAYWSRRLTEPSSAVDAPAHLTPGALDARRAAGAPGDAWIAKMAVALEARGVALEPDPLAKIEAANRAVLVQWLAVCERRFETQRVKADLERPTRAYLASELFQIGERILHPTFGEGVVEARAETGKVTVFFKTGRKVLVQAKDPPLPPRTSGRRR